jgi:hypothetical protein
MLEDVIYFKHNLTDNKSHNLHSNAPHIHTHNDILETHKCKYKLKQEGLTTLKLLMPI